MAQEVKTYDSCVIKYYNQLIDSITIVDDTGASVTVPYESIEQFVDEINKQKTIKMIENSEAHMGAVFGKMWEQIDKER